jgi:hypothetical protein
MGTFTWTGVGRTRTGLYHHIATMPEVDFATQAAAYKVKARAQANLDEANRWVRIVPHIPFKITMEHATGDKSAGSWIVSLEGDNPSALEYGHAPSGAFGPGGRYGHLKTKAPAGLYILHRAADLPGRQTARMGSELRSRLGRGASGDPRYGPRGGR